MSVQKAIQVGGKSVYQWVPAYTRAKGIANCLRMPLGPATGVGHFLMSRADLDALVGRPSVAVEFFMDDKTIKFPRMFLHSAVRATWGGLPDDPKAIYIAKVVDARFHLNRYTATSRAFNVRNFAGGDPNRYWIAETLDGTQPFTWQRIARTLWNDCKLLGAFPGGPFLSGLTSQAPEDLFFQNTSAWAALNEILSQFGRTVSYNGIADKFEIVKLNPLTLSPADASLADRLLFDSRPMSFATCQGPETIRVHFHKRFEDYGTEADTAASGNFLTSEPYYRIDVKTGIPGSLAGTVLPLWASTPAMLAHGESYKIANLAAIKAEADALAEGWIRENLAAAKSRAQAVLTGWTSEWMPDASIKVVSWRDFGDTMGGAVTEVVKYPGLPVDSLDGPQEPTAGAAAENFAGPDYARKTSPNYPRLPNFVQVIDPQNSQGKQVGPFKAGVFKGRVRRVNAGALTSLEDCWILFVDEFDQKQGNIKVPNGEIYYARLSGMKTVDKLRLPLYVARAGEASRVVQFRLKEDLKPGKGAKAKRIVLNVATGKYEEKEDIRVLDWYSTKPGMWSAPWQRGKDGVDKFCIEGFAIARGTEFREPSSSGNQSQSEAKKKPLPEYDIVWMETLAWTIEFELTQDMQGKSSKGTVLAFYEQGKDPSSDQKPIDLHDDNDAFPLALKGGKGTAIRSEHAGLSYYKIVQVQQMGFLAICESTADICNGAPIPHHKPSFKIISPSPFNLRPLDANLPAAIQNPRNHSVATGAEFLAEYNAKDKQWEVADARKYPLLVVVGSRLQGNCLQNQLQRIVTEHRCEDPYWETWHCGTECDGVGDPGGSGMGSGGQ